MPRRLLIATCPIRPKDTQHILGLDGKPIVSKDDLRDARDYVARELEHDSQRYVRDGWTRHEPTFDVTPAAPDHLLVGKMEVSRG